MHERFTVRQIENIRVQHPGVRVIVHPEVPWDVVQAADREVDVENARTYDSTIGSLSA